MKTAIMIILVIILSNGFISVYGQKDLKKGYIIDLNNDTIHGFIDQRGEIINSAKCYFFSDPKGEPRIYSPGEIIAYRFSNSRYYITRLVNLKDAERTVFLEYLVKGIINLYYIKDKDGDHYFMEKDGKLYELTNDQVTISDNFSDPYQVSKNGYKGVLNYLLFDTREILPDISSASFNRKSLSGITQKYHNLVCNDGKCIVYAKDTKRTVINFGPVIRYDLFNSIKFKGFFSPFGFSYSPSLMAGLGASFRLSSLNDKLYLGIKGYYLANTLTGFCSQKITNNNTDNYHINLDYKRILTSLDMSYRYPKGKLRPTAGIGFEMGFGFNENSTYIHDIFNQSGVMTSEDVNKTSLKYSYDADVSAVLGLTYDISRSSVFLNIVFSYGFAFYKETDYQVLANNVYYSPRISSIGIATGFLF